jgi:predicted Zn-dependent protease
MPPAIGFRFAPAAMLAALALALAGCQTVQTTAPGAIGVERQQQMLVSEAAVEQAAGQAYAQELQKGRTAGTLNANPALLQRTRRVSQRLIPQTRVFRPDAPGWNWEVNVLTTPELNAYAMPGGKIMVYSGLVEKLSLSDDELAAVIGHEISHALREHTRERVSRVYAQQIGVGVLAAIAGVGQGAADLANQVANVTFQLPHGREQEAEADRMGLELMARAGYDPNAAVSVWRKMAAHDHGAPPEFLSTHPSSSTRISDLQSRIPVVMPLYRAAKQQ